MKSLIVPRIISIICFIQLNSCLLVGQYQVEWSNFFYHNSSNWTTHKATAILELDQSYIFISENTQTNNPAVKALVATRINYSGQIVKQVSLSISSNESLCLDCIAKLSDNEFVFVSNDRHGDSLTTTEYIRIYKMDAQLTLLQKKEHIHNWSYSPSAALTGLTASSVQLSKNGLLLIGDVHSTNYRSFAPFAAPWIAEFDLNLNLKWENSNKINVGPNSSWGGYEKHHSLFSTADGNYLASGYFSHGWSSVPCIVMLDGRGNQIDTLKFSPVFPNYNRFLHFKTGLGQRTDDTYYYISLEDSYFLQLGSFDDEGNTLSSSYIRLPSPPQDVSVLPNDGFMLTGTKNGDSTWVHRYDQFGNLLSKLHYIDKDEVKKGITAKLDFVRPTSDGGMILSGTSLGYQLLIWVVKVAPLNSGGSLSNDQGFISSNTIDVYPNPTTDYLRIQSPGINIRDVKVYNANARLLLQTDDKMLDLRAFPKGVYYLVISSDAGEAMRRIVKE